MYVHGLGLVIYSVWLHTISPLHHVWLGGKYSAMYHQQKWHGFSWFSECQAWQHWNGHYTLSFFLSLRTLTNNKCDHTHTNEHTKKHRTVPVLMFIITFLFRVQMYGDLLYHIHCISNMKLLLCCSHGYDNEALQCCSYRTVGPETKIGRVFSIA